MKNRHTFKKGSLHYRWSRENPSYYAAHKRIYRNMGKPSNHRCLHCSNPAQEYALQKGKHYLYDEQKRPYSPFPEDYIPLCCPCHRRYDLFNQKVLK